MTTPWAPLIALYMVGICAYAVFNARALPPSVREIAAQDQVFAASVALSTIGTALIWPIAVVVLFGFALKARLERRHLKTPFFDRLQSGEHIESIVKDMGGTEPELRELELRELEPTELPPLPPCSGCGGALDYGQERALLNCMPAFDPEPVALSIDQIEMYTFCGDCIGRITDGCTPTPHKELIPVGELIPADAAPLAAPGALAELPPARCSSCDGEIDFADHEHGNLIRALKPAALREEGIPYGLPMDVEQFMLCGSCFSRASAGMTPHYQGPS